MKRKVPVLDLLLLPLFLLLSPLPHYPTPSFFPHPARMSSVSPSLKDEDFCRVWLSLLSLLDKGHVLALANAIKAVRIYQNTKEVIGRHDFHRVRMLINECTCSWSRSAFD